LIAVYGASVVVVEAATGSLGPEGGMTGPLLGLLRSKVPNWGLSFTRAPDTAVCRKFKKMLRLTDDFMLGP
jgi:hypothetical protein